MCVASALTSAALGFGNLITDFQRFAPFPFIKESRSKASSLFCEYLRGCCGCCLLGRGCSDTFPKVLATIRSSSPSPIQIMICRKLVSVLSSAQLFSSVMKNAAMEGMWECSQREVETERVMQRIPAKMFLRLKLKVEPVVNGLHDKQDDKGSDAGEEQIEWGGFWDFEYSVVEAGSVWILIEVLHFCKVLWWWWK